MAVAASSLPPARRVLALAPHPDDEVFGCGGTLHLLAKAGAAITVIVVSDGALGGMAGERITAMQIAEREAESRAAALLLGYPVPVFWRLPDMGLRYGEALVARLLDAMRAAHADLVFAPALTELHPDGQALALAAAESLRRLGGERSIAFYEVSALLLPNTLIDITTCEAQKRAAMRCFRSQLADQPYDEHVAALNRYRTYTLERHVHAAEAFFMATAAELANGLMPLFESALGRRRRLGVAVEGADMPLVSVIIRSMDRPTLAEALASVAAQTYPNIEVLVVNAKGGQHSALPDFSSRLVVRLIEKNGPLDRSRAANAGLEASRGRYLALLDDDDTLDPDHLSQLVATLLKEGNGVVAYAGVRGMDRNDPERRISHVFGEPFGCRAKLLAGNFIPSNAVLWPRHLVEAGARFDETLDVYEDWDFWLQISGIARFVYVDRITATYFTGGTSAVSPLVYDTDAVRMAMGALYRKWKDRITPAELKALCDLYLRSQADLTGSQREQTRLNELNATLVQHNATLTHSNAVLAEQNAALTEEQKRRDEPNASLAEHNATLAHSNAVLAAQNAGLATQLATALAELNAVRSSTSWRLTAPLRRLIGLLRHSDR